MAELEIGKYEYIAGHNLYCPKCEAFQPLTWKAHHLYDIGELYWIAECECGNFYKIRPTGFEVIDLNAPVV